MLLYIVRYSNLDIANVVMASCKDLDGANMAAYKNYWLILDKWFEIEDWTHSRRMSNKGVDFF